MTRTGSFLLARRLPGASVPPALDAFGAKPVVPTPGLGARQAVGAAGLA